MDTELLKDDISVGIVISAIASAIAGVVTWVLLYMFKRYTFFTRPENWHWTEYTEPVYLDQQFKVDAIQDPLTLLMAILPFVVMIIVAIYKYREGRYTD